MVLGGGLTIANGVLGIVASLAGAVLTAPTVEAAAGQATASGCCGAVVFVLPLVIGVWLIQGGRSFRAVATTDIADQEHLVAGLAKLRNIFVTKSVLIIAILGLFCLFAVVSFGALALFGLAAS